MKDKNSKSNNQIILSTMIKWDQERLVLKINSDTQSEIIAKLLDPKLPSAYHNSVNPPSKANKDRSLL